VDSYFNYVNKREDLFHFLTFTDFLKVDRFLKDKYLLEYV